MNYIGEHLLPGRLGHFFVLLSLVSSLVAAISFFKAAQSKIGADAASWKRLGRIAFPDRRRFRLLHFCNHLLYHPGSSISNIILPGNIPARRWISNIYSVVSGKRRRAVFCCGRCGIAVLGIILIFRAKQWEAPVMTVISCAQLCLATMIIGVIFLWDQELEIVHSCWFGRWKA